MPPLQPPSAAWKHRYPPFPEKTFVSTDERHQNPSQLATHSKGGKNQKKEANELKPIAGASPAGLPFSSSACYSLRSLLHLRPNPPAHRLLLGRVPTCRPSRFCRLFLQRHHSYRFGSDPRALQCNSWQARRWQKLYFSRLCSITRLCRRSWASSWFCGGTGHDLARAHFRANHRRWWHIRPNGSGVDRRIFFLRPQRCFLCRHHLEFASQCLPSALCQTSFLLGLCSRPSRRPRCSIRAMPATELDTTQTT
jgi:hypothetical protein